VATGSLRKGDTAPDFRVEYLEGGTTRLSELAKAHPVIVLNFFATWCGPCREELPELSRLGFDFRKEGLLVLAVSSERAQKISDFAGDQYPGVLLAKDPGGTGRFAFGVSGIPATFVLTRDRKVQAAYSGYSSTRMKELRDRVIALLRASPEAPASDSAPAGAGTRA
jgi:peroxiredoxin